MEAGTNDHQDVKMSEEQIRQKVKLAFAHVSGVPLAQIGDNAHFVNDLGLDELTIIEAAVELSREFRFEAISDEEEAFATVDAAVRYFHDRLNLQS